MRSAMIALGILILLLTGLSQSVPVHRNAEKVTTIHSGSASIDVYISDDQFAATHAELLAWVQTGVTGLTKYFGKFPVDRVRVVITGGEDGNNINGYEEEGSLIRMDIGRHTSAAQLADDWTMTHEMLHLAFPYMGEVHHWMNEGLSDYLEPIIRARAGIVSGKRYWRELHDGMEKGQPRPGDRGLDRTHTWSRTYWGGVIFWFLADVQIRQQTDGKQSVDDVIKKILDAGGDGSQEWPMDRVLNLGDAQTHSHVLHDLYNRLASKPERVSFDDLWQQMGIRFSDSTEAVFFDDKAPLALLRKAILRN